MEKYRYKILEEIGKGSFGTVFKARKVRADYAIKKVRCDAPENVELALQEFWTLSSLGAHNNIIRFQECFLQHDNDIRPMTHDDKTSSSYMYLVEMAIKGKRGWDRAQYYLWFVMEYCNCGDMNDYILNRDPIAYLNTIFMMQLADGIAFLHKSNVVHRDLKPENVLVRAVKGADPVLKIADFGLSKVCNYTSKQEDCDQTDDSEANVDSFWLSSACGSDFFMAPEVFQGRYTAKADVFALGIMFWAIMDRITFIDAGTKKVLLGTYVRREKEVLPVGEALLDDPNLALNQLLVDTGKSSSNSKMRSQSRSCINGNKKKLRDLIAQMVHPNPDFRPSSQDLLAKLTSVLHVNDRPSNFNASKVQSRKSAAMNKDVEAVATMKDAKNKNILKSDNTVSSKSMSTRGKTRSSRIRSNCEMDKEKVTDSIESKMPSHNESTTNVKYSLRKSKVEPKYVTRQSKRKVNRRTCNAAKKPSTCKPDEDRSCNRGKEDYLRSSFQCRSKKNLVPAVNHQTSRLVPNKDQETNEDTSKCAIQDFDEGADFLVDTDGDSRDSSIISEVPELDSGYKSKKSRRVSHPYDSASDKKDDTKTNGAVISSANTVDLNDISIGAGTLSNTCEDYTHVSPFTRRHIGLKQQINACKPTMHHDEDIDDDANTKDITVNAAIPKLEQFAVPFKPKIEVPRSPCVVLQSKARHHHNPHRTAVKKRWKYFVLDDVDCSSYMSPTLNSSNESSNSTAIATESSPSNVGKTSKKIGCEDALSSAQSVLGSDIPFNSIGNTNKIVATKGNRGLTSIHRNANAKDSHETLTKNSEGALGVSNAIAENLVPVDLSSRKRKLKGRDCESQKPSVSTSTGTINCIPDTRQHSGEMLRHLSNYWLVNQTQNNPTSDLTRLGSFQENHAVRSSNKPNATRQNIAVQKQTPEMNAAAGSIPVIDLTLDDEERIQPVKKRPRKMSSSCSCCSRDRVHANLTRSSHYSQEKVLPNGKQLTCGYNDPRNFQRPPSSRTLSHGYSLRDFKDLKYLSHYPSAGSINQPPRCVASTLGLTLQSQKVNSHYADPYAKLPPLIYCGSGDVNNRHIRTAHQAAAHQSRFNIGATNDHRPKMYFPHSNMSRAALKPSLPTRLSSPTLKMSNENFLSHISQAQKNPVYNK